MRTRLLSLLALLLAFTLVAAACGDDDDPVSSDADSEETADDSGSDEEMSEGSTVLDLAVEAGQFSTLVAAIEAAGLEETLAGEGPFTVLAPTDQAFEEALAALGLTAEELLASDALADILTYHVLAQEADSQLVATLDGQSVATVNGQEIGIAVTDGGIVINDTATVVSPDLAADNGIVHVINAVLLPPDVAEALGAGMSDDEMTEDEGTEEEAGPGTIVDVAAGNEDFSTLVAAVQAAGLVDALSDPEAELTVFAPTNDAFEAALAELGVAAEDLLADTELLTSILTYHVLDGIVDSAAAIAADGSDVPTLQGATIGVSVVDDGVVLTDQAERTANVVAVDVEASNGIIHVIDNVILPAPPA